MLKIFFNLTKGVVTMKDLTSEVVLIMKQSRAVFDIGDNIFACHRFMSTTA